MAIQCTMKCFKKKFILLYEWGYAGRKTNSVKITLDGITNGDTQEKKHFHRQL